MKRKIYLDKKGNPLRGIVLYNRLSKEKNISLDDSKKLAKLYMNQLEKENETLERFTPESIDEDEDEEEKEKGFATIFRMPTEIEGRDLKEVVMEDGRILTPTEAAQEIRAERNRVSREDRGKNKPYPIFDFFVKDQIMYINQ